MKNVNWSVFLPEMVVDEDGNGIIQKKIPANELAFYTRLLLPLGSEVTIESPSELVESIKQCAHEILEHYT
jgi:predicted DNA-binding transcriptional regulator YafY